MGLIYDLRTWSNDGPLFRRRDRIISGYIVDYEVKQLMPAKTFQGVAKIIDIHIYYHDHAEKNDEEPVSIRRHKKAIFEYILYPAGVQTDD